MPPRAAFNNEETRVYGLDDWLGRSEDSEMPGGRLERRGAGGHTYCADCNNKTGSWHGRRGRGARHWEFAVGRAPDDVGVDTRRLLDEPFTFTQFRPLLPRQFIDEAKTCGLWLSEQELEALHRGLLLADLPPLKPAAR